MKQLHFLILLLITKINTITSSLKIGKYKLQTSDPTKKTIKIQLTYPDLPKKSENFQNDSIKCSTISIESKALGYNSELTLKIQATVNMLCEWEEKKNEKIIKKNKRISQKIIHNLYLNDLKNIMMGENYSQNAFSVFNNLFTVEKLCDMQFDYFLRFLESVRVNVLDLMDDGEMGVNGDGFLNVEECTADIDLSVKKIYVGNEFLRI